MAISAKTARLNKIGSRSGEIQFPSSATSNETPQIEVPSKLFRVSDVITRPSAAPDEPGIYAWWFDNLPNVPFDSHSGQMGFRLAYVGIAPQKLGGRRTLRQRLRDHCRGPIAKSTLRRSLTAILLAHLNLHPYRDGKKIKMPDPQEERLSAWLEEHGRVAWISDPAPWVWEKKILQCGLSPPLNIQGNNNEFARELSTMRRQLAQTGAVPIQQRAVGLNERRRR
jgi:hypothetical protein